ncbi:MAG: hypothetical protein HYU54_00615 [Actinobacteria bacterium]|nr:hypothetical protein [Actinomycetota bacterium]
MGIETDETLEAERTEERRTWWKQRAGGLPLWAWAGVTVAVLFFVLGFGAWWTYGRGGRVPAVSGFYDGQEVTFIHTEASDPEVAKTLTGMVSSPVLVVPELTKVPDTTLGNVYVFTNGVEGPGPMGFQADVFDSAPTDPGYSPLRELNLVTWKEGPDPETLTSVAEIQEAAENGELQVEASGIVVNMPFVTWPGGHR